jgi:3-deoxy-manno-octulosonate cytidylyltransferase (CMP-KDO synthetase)
VFAGARRHVGIYGYRVGALLRVAALAPTALETTERLEQLRALANGLEIRVADAVERPGPDVNTAEDFDRVLTAASRL